MKRSREIEIVVNALAKKGALDDENLETVREAVREGLKSIRIEKTIRRGKNTNKARVGEGEV